MASSRARTWWVPVALALGCAQGGGLESTGSQFGVGTNASTTPMSTTASAEEESSAGGTEAQETGGGPGSGPGESEGCAADDPACGTLCGNGQIDPGETCDGDELDGLDCLAQGFDGGVLGCNVDCTLDTTGCTSASCGDGMIQNAEDCDCPGACTADQLGGQSCTSLAAPSGGNYSGGTLGCNPGACTFDTSGCVYCGNGTVDAGEVCDGANVGGATCASQGFDAGNLSCSASCTLDTSTCIDYVCGNGSCEPGEDACGCPQDCPNDPNSCDSPCECGGYGGACYCDDACVMYGDCCANGPC